MSSARSLAIQTWLVFSLVSVFPLYAENEIQLVPAPALGNPSGEATGATAAGANPSKAKASVLKPKNKATKKVQSEAKKGRDWKPAPVMNR
jgi:hypothetical protein